MEVRPGYKQTALGVIPRDWETDTMLRISRQIMDYRGRTPKKLGMEWGGGDIPALSAGNVKQGFVDFGEECYFGSDELYRRWMTKGDVAKDDILFTTEAPLGNVALVPDDRRYILSQRTILLQVDRQRASSTFLFQMMLSDRFQRMLADYSSGSTAKGIQRKKFEQLSVALPPLPEQCAIAAALSDVDALLGGLEQLIAKKRDLKQAAMQQLLTGQTRLPGFQGEWRTRRLQTFATPDRFAIVDGPFGSQMKVDEYVEVGVPVIEMEHLDDRYITERIERCITPKKFNDLIRSAVYPGDIVISKTGSLGKLGIIPKAVERGLITSRLAKISLDHSCADLGFVFQCLLKLRNDGYWEKVSQGGTMQILGIRMLQNAPIPDISLAEQSSIAAVLSDMDAELAALEARLDKTRNLKQAMMQELLTGRTRLVETAPDREDAC